MPKKRITITVDESTFCEFRDNVVSYGLPRSAVSALIQQFMRQTNADIDKYGISPQLELFDRKDKY